MAILIKHIEMPKHCWQCHFHDDVDDCVLLKQSCMAVWGENKRLDNCPLVEIKPNGRLIDADALKKKWLEAENRMGADKVLNLPLKEYISNGCVYDLDNAQTIIEREGSARDEGKK